MPLVAQYVSNSCEVYWVPRSLLSRTRLNSDRGSNYTSDEYAAELKNLGIRQSVGRTGICYDNALSESTNGALKVELVNREQFPTREIARRKIANYIELFYNRRRLHSGLGYNTPQEILDLHSKPQEAA